MRVSELTEIVLGDEAFEFLRWYLTERGDTLSRLILAQRIESGLIFSYLPSDVKGSKLVSLREGNVL